MGVSDVRQQPAVLELDKSATVLADLERSNLLLVPLDGRKEWYR